MRFLFRLACCLVLSAAAPALTASAPDDSAELIDGPHVFIQNDGLEMFWLCQQGLKTQQLKQPQWPLLLRSACGDAGEWRLQAPATGLLPDQIRGVKRWAALSDIHGQHRLALRLLQAQGVVDAAGRWQYGDGHLVVVGDVFDRGPEVTEALWFLYQLQVEAKAAGGAVHVLAGNHEQMALSGDLRYVHDKYQAAARAFGRSYPELFAANSLLGQWLRRLPTLLVIDDHLFVHGGISPAYMQVHRSITETNAVLAAVLDLPSAERKKDPLFSLLQGRDGPLWYRGYFGEAPLSGEALTTVLAGLGVQRIVVGHTTQEQLMVSHDGRVLAVDAGLKTGERGELLVFENGQYRRRTLAGALETLAVPPLKNAASP